MVGNTLDFTLIIVYLVEINKYLPYTNIMWNLAYILPNIQMGMSIGNEYVAFVPDSDERINLIIEHNHFVKAFVKGFTDQFRRPICPTCLIISDKAYKKLNGTDALLSYRNILAISNIIKGYEIALECGRNTHPKFSDYFDFYPIELGKNGQGFITKSPSVLGLDDEPEKFRGQSTPGLAANMYTITEDHNPLFQKLTKIWNETYINRSKKSTLPFYRSLEMAYQASTMPYENRSTIYDYGTKLSLWVSSIEILLHPKNEKVRLSTVIESLGKYHFALPELRNKYYRVRYGKNKKTVSVNFSQKLYKILYDTRNKFLHGEVASIKDLIYSKKKKIIVNHFGPILYKIALSVYLDDLYEIPFEEEPTSWSDYDKFNINQALLNIKRSK